MERKYVTGNVQLLHSQSATASAGQHLMTQVAALDATIAYCQTRRQQYDQKARALEALCSELQLRKTRPN